MIDELDHLTVGSLAFFVDLFATFPLVVQGAIDGRLGDTIGVSQSMNFVFHDVARLGTRLRATSTCVALGSRMMSGRCEIWDKDRNRLICSGVHLKMSPSMPRL
ncbi:hypothetical protein AURDEDRAFT_74411 [Auricularia subglabra TFB-10046 SS5]|uniref:Thioesterase domain-containing protein n=1 Tax=Auricularia subglabra (strain TFB-10046 / SS5) TaxID=717982 RepID=J0D945_AURST|nr:hypothetical protein AURDEDRAFT_74411 [Auricularia subglabra TFB-10046 SS5]